MDKQNPAWNPGSYLLFGDERSRPFVDLVARINAEPTVIVDLGCGPGHLTQVLRARWPQASILGVDSSPAMIEAAKRSNDDPAAQYLLADLADWTPTAQPDLIISNATYQWLPDQLPVLERLRNLLAPGGVFAFQVPANFDGPSHRLLHEIAARRGYQAFTRGIETARGLPIDTYLDLFAGSGWTVDAWQTSYQHLLPGEDPVFTWISATGARPVLHALPDDLRELFVAEYKAALRAAYPQRAYGTVLPFARSFVVAGRP